MWLASVSRRALSGATVPTPLWRSDPGALTAAEDVLLEVLGGAGDRGRERLFRMNVTLCLHRGLTAAEEERIGPGCAVHLAGAPIEVLRETGVRASAAAQPCDRPRRVPLSGTSGEPWFSDDPWLWFPEDCERCGPCRARLAILARRPPSG